MKLAKKLVKSPITLGLLIPVTTVFYLLGIFLPILQLEKVFGLFTNEQSIVSGLILLLETSEYLLFGVILIFSVIFPIVKLVIISLLAHRLYRHGNKNWSMLRRLENMGKWSMLDVFVVAQLVVFVKLGSLAQVHPRIGIVFFATCVLLSMFCSCLMSKAYEVVEELDEVAETPRP